MSPFFQRFRFLVPFALSGLLAASPLTGCNWFKSPPGFIIPPMPTAREQYEVADTSYQRAKIEIRQTGGAKTETFDEAEAAFRMVVERFPNDDFYVARARLMMARCEFGRNNFARAVQLYRAVVKDFPNDTDVQEIGLFELGLSLDNAKEYAESKVVLAEFLRKFPDQGDSNPERKRRVQRANEIFMKIQTE